MGINFRNSGGFSTAIAPVVIKILIRINLVRIAASVIARSPFMQLREFQILTIIKLISSWWINTWMLVARPVIRKSLQIL
jgi:hypothetical protein